MKKDLQLHWISASEGDKFANIVSEMFKDLEKTRTAGEVMEKPKMALYWCSSCGGCEESVIDIGLDLLKVNRTGRYCLLASGNGYKIQ